jgi:uncharacterized protein YbaR (Trm112 family)
MRLDFLKMLVCPRHKSELDLSILNRAGENIVSGELICKSNGCRYEIRKSIPRFVDSDDYADSFSKQRLYVRQHFDDYRHDRSGDRILEPSTGFNKEILQNGVTLEVGCGYGRFSDTIYRMGGRAVGVDLSTHSIELARDFDNLSPTYAFSHSAEEVQKWFTQEGLNDVRILERATSVTGVKPS